MKAVDEMSVRELKAEIVAAGMSHSDCTEKRDLKERVAYLRKATRPAPAPFTRPNPRESVTRERAAPTDAATKEIQRILECEAGDMYAILGVSRNADGSALKKSYRRLALLCHPDKTTADGADDAFKRVGGAFAVLRDSGKRRAYDWGFGDDGHSSSSSSSQRSAGARTRTRAGTGTFGDEDAADLFRAFFGDDGTGGTGAEGQRDQSSALSPFSTDSIALSERLSRAGALCIRLGATFKRNPMSLVTLLCGLISLLEIIERLTSSFGVYALLVPVGGGGLMFAMPREHRAVLGMTVFAILCSGLL
jgi:hypothetical protein